MRQSHHEVDEAGAAAQKSFIELFEAEFLAGVKHDKAEGRHVFVLTKDEGQAGAVACAVSEAVKGLAALFDAVQIVGDDELLVALGHGAHDRVAEKALLERRGRHGTGLPSSVEADVTQPLAVLSRMRQT